MPPPAGFASPVPAHRVPSGPMASAPIVWVLAGRPDRGERHALVGALPDAAAGRRDIDRRRVAGVNDEVDHPAADVRRADRLPGRLVRGRDRGGLLRCLVQLGHGDRPPGALLRVVGDPWALSAHRRCRRRRHRYRPGRRSRRGGRNARLGGSRCQRRRPSPRAGRPPPATAMFFLLPSQSSQRNVLLPGDQRHFAGRGPEPRVQRERRSRMIVRRTPCPCHRANVETRHCAD